MKKLNFRKFKGFAHRHKISATIIMVTLLAGIGIVAYDFYQNPTFENTGINLRPKKETRVPAPYTGILTDAGSINKRPLAVVIENSPEARPQSGYNQADVVYETLAEGGITRTLAIFHSQEANEIGPVRSARPYFIDWLSEYNALFAHVGGSIDALDYIKSAKISDLNQFNFGSYFWRSTSRYAPHNVYTTTAKLYQAATSAKYDTTSNDHEWYDFKTDLPEVERPASQKVTVNFSQALFSAAFTYNPKTNDYVRAVAGVIAKDRATGEEIRVKNVIVQYETVGYGRTRANEQKVDIGTTGKGNGFLFQDGKATKIRWEKSSRTSLTKITDEAGNEIKLNPGRTWICVPPVGANVTY